MKTIYLRLVALCGILRLVSATSAQNTQPNHTSESSTQADTRGLNTVKASDTKAVGNRVDFFLQYNF